MKLMKYYFITACAGSLVLLLLMQTASGAMIAGNEYFNGMAASTNDINLSIMKKAPVAVFSCTPKSGSRPLTVTFIDSSKGSITSKLWEYKLNSVSTWTTFTLDRTSSFSFVNAGIYDVRLTVTGQGSSDSKTEPRFITVNEATPVAAFSGMPTSGSQPLNVQFTDASTGIITSYTWNFGDGGSSNIQNPSHQYTTDGTYTVNLIVTGPGGSSLKTEPNYISVANTMTKIGIYKEGVWSLDFPRGVISDTSLSWGISGDIQVIGDWNANGKDDIGIFRQSSGIWSLDSNGNSKWDVTDKSLSWGLTGDIPVVGDWNGDKKSDIGIFRPSSGIWSLDSNGNLAWEVSDTSLSWGLPNDVPVIGDWNGDGTTKIGILRPNSGIWSLDSNGDGVYLSSFNPVYTFLGEAGWTPLVGDWNGSGTTKIGVYKTGTLYLDYNGNGVWDSIYDKGYNFGLTSDFIPVVGDWNGDGKTKVGFYRWGYWSLDYYGVGTKSKFYTFPYADIYVYSPIVGDWNGDKITEIGAYTYTNGDWCLDYDGNGVWNSGLDRWYNLGGSGSMPVVGDWNGDGKDKIGVFKDGAWRLDYDGNFAWNTSVNKSYTFVGGAGWMPVVGDWNGDGKDKIGVYNTINGDWNLDYDGNGVWDATADKGYNIGVGIPVVGKWS
jgi:PKD repeat protein